MLDIEKASGELFDIFEQHSEDSGADTFVSGEGIDLLAAKFEEVPLENKADVFAMFIDRLHHAEYNFDPAQFTGNVEEVPSVAVMDREYNA